MFNRALLSADYPQFQPLVAQLETRVASIPSLHEAGLLRPLSIESLQWGELDKAGVRLSVLRADLLHPVISGNKWFKLKYNLLGAIEGESNSLLSVGGAWSNHLHALAYAGYLLGLTTMGIVRGEELTAASNPMLGELQRLGMQLQFVNRARYREICRELTQSADEKADLTVIPEGGDNVLGLLGASTLINPQHLLQLGITHIIGGVGTGCTFAGLRLSAPETVNLIGVSALKGDWVRDEMTARLHSYRHWLSPLQRQNWQLLVDYHRGGFGRADEYLLSFIQQFADNTGLQLEPLYTGKAMLALLDLVEQQLVPVGSHVLFVHSGGLQGNRGFANFTK